MTAPTASPLESTVEQHIDSTSRLVRRVDIAFSLLLVVSLLLGGLFLAVIADHWLKDGLSIPLRFGIFAALVTAAGFYVYWKIVPLLRYPINPVYTADLIEKDGATFKNSLINWLLIRQEREENTEQPEDKVKINDKMYRGIVRTAAAKVQTVPAGHAVNLRKLIWVGTVFAVLFIVFIAYAAFSPKSPFPSIWRVFLPGAGIERPQAAQFRNVKPGDAVVLQGETLTISAEVISRSAEPVYLVFSTDDGQAVNQRIPMLLPEGKSAFETLFPPGKQGTQRGFHSSVDYRIAQGESQSKQYRIDVQPAASVEIVSLRYDFPDYTGLPPEVKEHGGDVRALEGTTVTVSVRSTLPLQKIDIVFDENPTSNVLMQVVDVQKTEAKGTFTLKTSFPYKTFSFRATDANGNASRRSGIYRIEVIPDQPPKVQWADTADNLREVAQFDLPLNETLALHIQAEDPAQDGYHGALRYLRFKTESTGKRIPDVSLLDSPTSGPTDHRGQIRKTVSFSPMEKRLTVGDTAEIWAEAIDAKLPEANVSATRRIKINVIDPKDKEEEEQRQDKGGDKGGGKPQQDDNQEQGADNTDQNKDDQNKEGDEGKQEGNENSGEENTADKNAAEQDSGEQQNPNEQEQSEGNQNKEKENKQDQNRQDTSEQGESEQNDQQGGEGKQGGDESGDSNQGAAGDKPGEGGEQGSGAQPENGKKSDSPPDNKPVEGQPAEEKQKGEGSGGERTGNDRTGNEKHEQNSNVNSETQDGDAMERIVEQMKEEGLFPGANPFLRNDNKNMRSDSLDPNSPNQTNQGNDPTNPKPSNRPPEGKPQEKPQDGEPKNGEPKEGNKSDSPESGHAGDMDSPSGDQQGNPQKEQNDGSPDSQGGQDNAEGSTQEGKNGGEGSAEQAPQGNNPQDGDSGTEGVPGGTGGGDGAMQETTPDDPNLKYANEVTNMVLDYLENQLKDKSSDELLKKLGWTEDELRQFYDRWKKMSDNSKKPDGNGKKAMEEAWKSWNLLRPPSRPVIQGSPTGRQDNRRVTEAQRPSAPTAIQERFRRYNDNVGKENTGK